VCSLSVEVPLALNWLARSRSASAPTRDCRMQALTMKYRFYPKTEVTILHSQKLLLNATYPDSFRSKWGQQLEKTGVKLVLDDAALNIPENAVDDIEGPVTTKGGKTLQADLVVCFNSSSIALGR